VTDRLIDSACRAVLEREEIRQILTEGHAGSPADTRALVTQYLNELRTTQRYYFYRALQHPLYPIFRKITRIVENPEIPRRAVKAGRVIYVSNHKSHTDYLVQLVVVDDLGLRPPLIAAGINLFGGALGLINRHVTGAIPIRRNTKDPVYLMTLKAYVAEVLRRRDLFFYPEGGRSYSGEIKPMKTGLLHASLQAHVPGVVIVPVAIAYDLVLEDRALARQGGVKRRQRPFTRELAEMLTMAVGYKTRAFVTFGDPIELDEYEADARRDVVELAHRTKSTLERLYKVVPTALVATAMRSSVTVPDLELRVADLIGCLQGQHANLAETDASRAVEAGTATLIKRGIIHKTGARLRVRERSVLRYYARTIRHLLPTTAETSDGASSC
jgi:1-acyl-sn-glycerol-3-phosphate acyltransferase